MIEINFGCLNCDLGVEECWQKERQKINEHETITVIKRERKGCAVSVEYEKAPIIGLSIDGAKCPRCQEEKLIRIS